ncbi:hypothetical protein AGABI2DRAFT_182557 [Agaricus bisporus var. bisporus H97]|uniref:hypothetical protein n=1 Tax=Agaricus bisporus var. bisporus (strain H97 / ATCC MYA-4626 / FGSC 10389) TaxID=936046 RepID=UPI00029F6C2D|nr:hypothetical protein AGABI2DRAFT_182557 [Agaricus bisporus var. bisporus H97]EKV51611.1 hypothetical protein AGABI2DRAFT_182557 [Agaricus bisporus var. bisporus H97]
MPKLGNRGIIAIATIGFYAPVAILTLVLLVRYALRRDAGWLFLFIFSLARMAGGALLVAARAEGTNVDLFIASYIIDAAALSFLMMSTLGFLGMVGHRTFSENPRVIYNLRTLGILALGALAVTITGGVLGKHVGFVLRRVGSGIYGGMYVFLVLVHLGAWTYRWHLKSYRRKLMWGISIGLIPLGARTAYAILASWSSADLLGTQPSDNPVLARSNPVTGHLALYLVLSLVMEYLVVLIYLYSSVVLSRRHR